jgi:hypothetical protein
VLFFYTSYTSIRSTVIAGQTEGLMVGCRGMGGRKDLVEEWVDRWAEGWI